MTTDITQPGTNDRPQPAPDKRTPQSTRVIVVGDDALAQRVTALEDLVGPIDVVFVPGFLAAIGEAAVEAPAAVLGPYSATFGMAQALTDSLHRLAPDCQLVVSVSGDQTGAAGDLLEQGFDGYVLERDNNTVLAGVLGLAPDERDQQPEDVDELVDESAVPKQQTGSDLRRSDNTAANTATQSATNAAATDADDARLRMVIAAQSPDAIHSKLAGVEPLTEPGKDEPVGDVDLVDHVLHQRGDVAGLALRLARQASNITGLSFATGSDQVPSGNSVAVVSQGRSTFGMLHAPPPTDDKTLAPWATWMARWLALDHHVERLRTLAYHDDLTGLYNRRYFHRFLRRVTERARLDRIQVTLLLFDIDDFKLYNDRFGHPAGDEILRESARLMRSVVREHDVVARIGGDEFAVVFWEADEPRKANSKHPHDVIAATKRFQHAICGQQFPKLLDDARSTLTISGGLATFPWDGRTPDELIARADAMALASKQQGKNVITFGPGALRQCGLDQ